jgi:hypothetical protein
MERGSPRVIEGAERGFTSQTQAMNSRSHSSVGAKASRELGLPGERGPRVYGVVDMLSAVSLGEPIDIAFSSCWM